MSIVEKPTPPAWIASSEWRRAGWEAGWREYWNRCLDLAGPCGDGFDIAEAKRLWGLRQKAAVEVIAWSQTPAAEGDSFFGTKSCWENSARRAVQAMTLA